jgi:hypothetical protein
VFKFVKKSAVVFHLGSNFGIIDKRDKLSSIRPGEKSMERNSGVIDRLSAAHPTRPSVKFHRYQGILTMVSVSDEHGSVYEDHEESTNIKEL